MVNFWATWCPPCAKEMPGMVKLGEALTRKYPGKFRMVAVSVDEDTAGAHEVLRRPGLRRACRKDVVIAREPGIGQVTRAYYCVGRGRLPPAGGPAPGDLRRGQAGAHRRRRGGRHRLAATRRRPSYLESLIKG